MTELIIVDPSRIDGPSVMLKCNNHNQIYDYIVKHCTLIELIKTIKELVSYNIMMDKKTEIIIDSNGKGDPIVDVIREEYRGYSNVTVTSISYTKAVKEILESIHHTEMLMKYVNATKN